MLGTKPIDTPMDIYPSIWDDSGDSLEDKAKSTQLVGKLIYLTITRPDISFVVGLVSSVMKIVRDRGVAFLLVHLMLQVSNLIV